jgi:hypothetical protein
MTSHLFDERVLGSRRCEGFDPENEAGGGRTRLPTAVHRAPRDERKSLQPYSIWTHDLRLLTTKTLTADASKLLLVPIWAAILNAENSSALSMGERKKKIQKGH